MTATLQRQRLHRSYYLLVVLFLSISLAVSLWVSNQVNLINTSILSRNHDEPQLAESHHWLDSQESIPVVDESPKRETKVKQTSEESNGSTTDMIHEPAISLPNKVETGKEPVTITVLVDKREGGWKDFSFSLFDTQQLQRYSHRHHQGLYSYRVEFIPMRTNLTLLQKYAQPPCVLVSNPAGLDKFRQEHAPQCSTWIINDEFCRYSSEVRFYYRKEHRHNSTFVPLGPRYDFFQAMQKSGGQPHHNNYFNLTKGPPPPPQPASQRRYIFNAIFTKATSPSRKTLKEQLLADYSNVTTTAIPRPEPDEFPNSRYFIQIPVKWRRQMHPTFNVQPDQYYQVLSQSIFTLSPNGHNPECFRLYEAVLAGSIPVFVMGEKDEYHNHSCPDALAPLLEQPSAPPPFVIMDDWTQLNSTLESILREGPQALNKRQNELLEWYHAHFMPQQVEAFEDRVVGFTTGR